MKKVLKKPSLGEEDQTMLTESERESKQTDLLPVTVTVDADEGDNESWLETGTPRKDIWEFEWWEERYDNTEGSKFIIEIFWPLYGVTVYVCT